MPVVKKKGTTGASRNYITRSQAVRKLQLTLPDFRRLCIFKGVYPREPRSAKRVSRSSTPSTTFYYAKDIAYLLHEPLLAKFRDQKSLAKKISKALGRDEVENASRLERNLTPRLRLDHVIKERYPTFVDALRDLDDALSLLFLFASLPSTADVPPKVIQRCQRLTLEFEHYIIRAHALRKSFLSIKGIYYQALLHGQEVLWLVPYRFVQRANEEVDWRIMATFVEFYASLVGFVNFRLYTGVGLVYPPRLDLEKEEKGVELGAFKLESLVGGDESGEADVVSAVVDSETNQKAQAEADRLLLLPAGPEEINAGQPQQPVVVSEPQAQPNGSSLQQQGDDEDTEQTNATSVANTTAVTTLLDAFPAPLDPLADILPQPPLTADSARAAELFEPFTFFLSRETPRHPLEFVLKSFGCRRVGWATSTRTDRDGAENGDVLKEDEGSYCQESDRRITHQVVDRPELPISSRLQSQNEEVETLQEAEDVSSFLDRGLDDGAPRSAAFSRSAAIGNERVPGRIYVQPQWVWDSINAGELQKPDLYAPGAELPPHLSPWVKKAKGVYDPTAPLGEPQGTELDDVMVEDDADEGEDDVDTREEDRQSRQTAPEGDDEGMNVAFADEDDNEDELAGAADISGAQSSTTTAKEDKDDEWAGFDSSDELAATETTATAARQHQAELEAEALGTSIPAATSASTKAEARRLAEVKRVAEAKATREDVERRMMMMPRRKRKMYEKMVWSNARKEEEGAKLRGKRRRVEAEVVRQGGS